jgi:hypothetical protein
MAGNPDCKKEGHTMHICALKASGFDTENPDKFREITENPQYKCDNCGAMAKESENLCKPIEL